MLECYAEEIDKHANSREKTARWKRKKVIDEDMCQALVLKLIEAIPQFPLEKE